MGTLVWPHGSMATSQGASDMNDGLVSIVTPAWKAAPYVAQTIASVKAQSYPNWELLITDDCSPDNTFEVLQEHARSDPRIKPLRQDRNGGPAAARNAGLQRAQGRWIAFLDSDDLWLPNKLDLQLTALQNSDACLGFTGFRRIDALGQVTGRYIGVPSRLSYRQLLGNTAIATSTVLVDRKRTGDFQMKATYYDDFACWLELLRPHRWAIGIDQDLMRYRVMSHSVSRNKGKSAREVWNTYRRIEQLGTVTSAWYFSNYAARAWWKYRVF